MSSHALLPKLAAFTVILCSASCKTASAPEDSRSSPLMGDAFWPMAQHDIRRTGSALAPSIYQTPELAWRARVGLQTRHNSPIVTDELVIVGSAGLREGEADAEDGVYAVDLQSGVRRWFTHVNQDVHGTSWFKGRVIAAGDDGVVRALDARDGSLIWSHEASGPTKILSSPLVLADHGLVIITTMAGDVLFLDAAHGTLRHEVALGGEIVGGAASDGTRVFVATTAGVVVALSLEGEEFWRTRHVHRIPSDSIDTVETRPSRIIAAPTVTKDFVVLPFRPAVAIDTPPWFALDRLDGRLRWEPIPLSQVPSWEGLDASANHGDDQLVFPIPGSRAVVGYLIGERRADFVSFLPTCTRFAWASLVRASDTLYQARMDGMLSGHTTIFASVEWHAFVGDVERYPKYPDENRSAPGECPEAPAIGHGISSTPALARDGSIIVGTGQGYLLKMRAPEASSKDAPEVNTSGAAAPE